jgi:hypothetical protein
LRSQHLLITKERISTLDASIASANLSISNGLLIYEKFETEAADCYLTDDLHLLYICMPTNVGFTTPSYNDNHWTQLHDGHEHVFHLTVRLPRLEWECLITGSFLNVGSSNEDIIDHQLYEFYCACIILSIIEERRFYFVEQEFRVDGDTIESLQSSTATIGG